MTDFKEVWVRDDGEGYPEFTGPNDGRGVRFVKAEQSHQAACDKCSTELAGSITLQTEDELRVLVELLCHTTGAPGFDARIERLREEVKSKWSER